MAVGNVKFTDEDGVSFDGINIATLMQKVREYREENGGDLSLGWQDRVGTQICDQGSYKFCYDKAKPVERKLSVSDISVFFSTMARWKRTGFELASGDKAEGRASICSSCPNNVKIAGCSSCFKLLNKVKSVIGDKTTSKDDVLEGCSVCACSLKAKVWLPIEAMQGTKHVFPSHCWLNKHIDDSI